MTQFRLRYTATSHHAHLNRAAFPWPYATRDDAEKVRALCVRPEWVEVYEDEES